MAVQHVARRATVQQLVSVPGSEFDLKFTGDKDKEIGE